VLTAIAVGPVTLDVCQGGCGGLWFDAHELEQVNQTASADTPPHAEVDRNPDRRVDAKRRRFCTRCPDTPLERKLFSLSSGVIMDLCPQCHGIWLDYGELETIRKELYPPPSLVRHVIPTPAPVRRIPINFGVVQKVQHLRIQR
jgi:Zn-finger nucleic acid-binding protein